LYEFERLMEDMALLFPSAKNEVWVRRSVVSVTAVGERSRSDKKKTWSLKRRKRGMFCALVCVTRKRVSRSKSATARSVFR